MSYSIELGPQAVADLQPLPLPVQRGIIRALEPLAESPSKNARSAPPPYPPGMLFRAEFHAQDVQCLIDVVFRYGQDEQTLHLDRIFIEYA